MATTKVRVSLRTKILLPFTAFTLVTVGVLATSALQARNEVAQQVEARVSSMAEVFGELFASSVLAGDETNWRQIDQVIESIQKEDAKKGFFAFILVKGGDDEIVGSFNPSLLDPKYAQDVSDIRLDRKQLDDAEAAVAAAEDARAAAIARAADPAARTRAEEAEDARIADLRDRAAARFDALAQKKRSLFKKILAEPRGRGLRVYTALIHDCRPDLCPTDEASLAKLPAEATVLVGIAYAPFARERQLNLALLAAIACFALVLGAGGAWWIAGSVTRPVKTLMGAIENVERGTYERVEVESRDEIGALARTFNTMAMGLADKEALRVERERLELRVKQTEERVRETEEENEELLLKKKRVEEALAGLASVQVARRFLEERERLDFRGAADKATILFADIRGFTSMCERMSPDEVFGMLNDYFARMRTAIDRYGGCILKFMGDALMVSYNVPEKQDHHALRAVYTGIDMQREILKLNREREAAGKEAIKVGIGINTGELMVGNVGSEGRFDYTVIGDAVNTAQRIESITPEKHLHISESTWADVQPYVEVVAREPVYLKGKEKPVQIYAVVRRTKSVVDFQARKAAS